MALDENAIDRTVFSNARNEAGINLVYDPELNQDLYQVFIHNLLPYREISSSVFKTFNEARSFAANTFSKGWEMHYWDFTLRRKCGTAEDGISCGSGGGCASCATKEGGLRSGTDAAAAPATGGGCSACQIEQD